MDLEKIDWNDEDVWFERDVRALCLLLLILESGSDQVAANWGILGYDSLDLLEAQEDIKEKALYDEGPRLTLWGQQIAEHLIDHCPTFIAAFDQRLEGGRQQYIPTTPTILVGFPA